MVSKLRLVLIVSLLVGGGCATHETGESGLYPLTPYERVWAGPANNPFDPEKARAEVLPAMFLGRRSQEGAERLRHSSDLEIQACAEVVYKADYGKIPRSVAVVVSRSDEDPVSDLTEGRLVLVENGCCLASHILGGGDRDRYSLTLIDSKFERNPLVLLFKNEGGNTRDFSYELYRIEDRDLRCLWKWDEDGETTSGDQWFSFSNVDFSGLISGKRNELCVYTTFKGGGGALHKTTRFTWSKSADGFVGVNRYGMTSPR